MPYIITTSYRRFESDFENFSVGVDHMTHPSPKRWTRTAVATLEEARERMSGIIGDVYIRTGDALDAEWAAFLDSKLPGTIGPLPDGTVIEVRPASWMDLKIHTDLPGDPHGTLSHATIIAAFNDSQRASA